MHGSCIVNEAMMSGESTPLLKESIELLEGSENLDVDVAHKNQMLFSGTKVLQARSSGKHPHGSAGQELTFWQATPPMAAASASSSAPASERRRASSCGR